MHDHASLTLARQSVRGPSLCVNISNWHGQVVTVKSKYVVENQTGMALEVKQRGTPDLQDNTSYGVEDRCACCLPHDSRHTPCGFSQP